MNALRFLLNSYLKPSKLRQDNRGFTLLELLVAMVLAALVVTPLMSFTINILDSDRREQAKAISAQEVQASIEYIAQDLEQAVYIYDAIGLNNNSNLNTNTISGIKDQIPPEKVADGCSNNRNTTCTPVLVFWKREPVEKAVPTNRNSKCSGISSNCNDTFVYSLVAYYLIKGNNINNVWSNSARIARFQITNGVVDPFNPTNTTNGIPTTNYIQDREPSPGFNLFDLSLPGSSLSDKMNRWQKSSLAYTSKANVLIDYVDSSITEISPNCSANQQTPSTLVGGFYACVDASKTSAQIFIRGNALARLQQSSTYSNNLSAYFPTASIKVNGRSSLDVN
ncbi:hormogonium polysaccharide secretion pseudopilin HpsC [Aliterella atlantica]|uniref:Prepilin-type N-terminal cleavage/methylation domain-containing protein n=1 Tax=Aliterella atlantica CENA595 TaxID=1618023 RepID=A0A0D8ZV49_9CYAN|nr:hormogonium polysaccharide secretion pseudopilin HpsC [Aliterella atlantica]KJH72237.1 hypothetical protein UH38_07290 [Aliterella atlantica CENA595]